MTQFLTKAPVASSPRNASPSNPDRSNRTSVEPPMSDRFRPRRPAPLNRRAAALAVLAIMNQLDELDDPRARLN